MNKSLRHLLTSSRPFGDKIDLADTILRHGKWPSRYRIGEFVTLQDEEEARDIAFDIHLVSFYRSKAYRPEFVDSYAIGMVSEICSVTNTDYVGRDLNWSPSWNEWHGFLADLAKHDPVTSKFIVKCLALGDVDLACKLLWNGGKHFPSTDDVFDAEFIEILLARQPNLTDEQYKRLFEQCIIAFGTSEAIRLMSTYSHPSSHRPEIIGKIPWDVCADYPDYDDVPLSALFAISEHGIDMAELHQLCCRFPEHQWDSMSSMFDGRNAFCSRNRKNKSDVNLIQGNRRDVVELIGQVISINSLAGLVSQFVFAELRNID